MLGGYGRIWDHGGDQGQIRASRKPEARKSGRRQRDLNIVK